MQCGLQWPSVRDVLPQRVLAQWRLHRGCLLVLRRLLGCGLLDLGLLQWARILRGSWILRLRGRMGWRRLLSETHVPRSCLLRSWHLHLWQMPLYRRLLGCCVRTPGWRLRAPLRSFWRVQSHLAPLRVRWWRCWPNVPIDDQGLPEELSQSRPVHEWRVHVRPRVDGQRLRQEVLRTRSKTTHCRCSPRRCCRCCQRWWWWWWRRRRRAEHCRLGWWSTRDGS